MLDSPVPEILSECEHFLNRLSENDLHTLNSMVVERLKLYHKAHHVKNLAKFNLMDNVSFQHNGQYITGIIVKLNMKSASIRTTDGRRWNVSPSLLTRLPHA